MRKRKAAGKDSYRRNPGEWAFTLFSGIMLCAAAGILFYEHICGVLAMLVFLPFYVRFDGNRRREKEKEQMEAQFKDALTCMAAAMQAGSSVERAVRRAAEELPALYPEKAPILLSLKVVCARLELNETVEQAFYRLGEETGIGDIKDFAQVLITAKRTGGNLIQIMEHTAGCMEVRQEVKREIRTLISGKKLEATLMNLLPPGILLYLRAGLPDLAKPLYHNLPGAAVMTMALAVYGFTFWWSQKLVRIPL